METPFSTDKSSKNIFLINKKCGITCFSYFMFLFFKFFFLIYGFTFGAQNIIRWYKEIIKCFLSLGRKYQLILESATFHQNACAHRFLTVFSYLKKIWISNLNLFAKFYLEAQQDPSMLMKLNNSLARQLKKYENNVLNA